MDIIDNIINSLRFKDTIIYKNTSSLQDKYNALKKLNEEYPNNSYIQSELYITKKGLDGENEIEYQLKKSNIGMYVLRDVKVRYEDLTAQIDYIIITSAYTYYVECKNLTGNIIINENGDFIREINVNNKKIRKGMYSPLRQVESQREVIRKIWEKNSSKFKKIIASNKFNYYRRVLVVAANQDTILNTKIAPKDIKSKVLRIDSLVRKIQYDIDSRSKDEYLLTKKEIEEIAKSYLDISVQENVDYYNYYMEKIRENNQDNVIKEILIKFRKKRALEMNIPAYYVYTNEELDKLVSLKPKTLEELVKSNIFSNIKIKTHGEKIIEEINKR